MKQARKARKLGAVAGLTLLSAGIGLLGTTMPSLALSLEEAMAAAFAHNPEMKRERSNMLSAQERLTIARGASLPSITVDLSAGRSKFESDLLRATQPGGEVDLDPRNARVLVDQPLFNAGGISAGIDAAESELGAAGFLVVAREQKILRAVANAYVDALLNKAIVALNEQNVEVLQKQKKATEDRRAAGLLTPTDVAQADARLARSQTALVDAQVRFDAARYNLEELIAVPGEALEDINLPDGIPASLDDAVGMSLAQHPSLLAGRQNEVAAQKNITVARSAYMPRVSLQGEYNYLKENDRRGGRTEERAVQLAMSMPLFQGGAGRARVRDASIQHNISQLDLAILRRQLVTATRNAWARLGAARAAIKSADAQLKASTRALEGVRREAKLGSRTTLDVLDAEQELLEAEVTLTQGKMEEARAAYDLLELTGNLTASNLTLGVTGNGVFSGTERGVVGRMLSTDPQLGANVLPDGRWDDAAGSTMNDAAVPPPSMP